MSIKKGQWFKYDGSSGFVDWITETQFFVIFGNGVGLWFDLATLRCLGRD